MRRIERSIVRTIEQAALHAVGRHEIQERDAGFLVAIAGLEYDFRAPRSPLRSACRCRPSPPADPPPSRRCIAARSGLKLLVWTHTAMLAVAKILAAHFLRRARRVDRNRLFQPPPCFNLALEPVEVNLRLLRLTSSRPRQATPRNSSTMRSSTTLKRSRTRSRFRVAQFERRRDADRPQRFRETPRDAPLGPSVRGGQGLPVLLLLGKKAYAAIPMRFIRTAN